MKKPEVFFRPIGQSGPLSLYWHSGPYGNAVECKEGTGVAWLSPSGELLGVEFDDVNKETDHQILIPSEGPKIEIFVTDGIVKVKTHFEKAVTKI